MSQEVERVMFTFFFLVSLFCWIWIEGRETWDGLEASELGECGVEGWMLMSRGFVIKEDICCQTDGCRRCRWWKMILVLRGLARSRSLE
ncbi:hypothetical protein DL98DRAFT_231798 [Cadophora sp. DSE1049]|nr:hypothetical protein DL98DRAFT_231798 [Cadophora sp. DSE1049]